MQYNGRPEITAILGPTNTGKTHLAVERMLGHSSGMIGFPLRLLAREVYDRVVRMRGAELAALITGEERIWPETARYLLCTAEAMPMQVRVNDSKKGDGPRDVAFVALDEAQIAQDSERGHVFTARLLHARGRDETMILGSSTMRNVVRQLVPEAEITTRPRFSTLTYDGPRKLRRLPPRSAIIAFSTEEVYAIAEALRRVSGGAAVVTGALSPRTRNAQVAMFQSGEVDYLVATDAVGMGLNLSVEHVAFASLTKFDGNRHRRLTVPEMAQIAGRAGRHQRDGTFGSVGAESLFTAEEVRAIEEHQFDAIDWIYWRNPDPSLESVAALIADLEAAPDHRCLRAAPLSSDLAVMHRLHDDADAMAPIDGPDMVRRFRDVCSLPDFRNRGPDAHRQLVARVWTDLSRGNGHVDAGWYAGQLKALDVMAGSIETLSDRIAAVRSLCYIAQRADWLAEPAAMAEAARDVEARLSDALHDGLTARFVDRRTAVLLRALGEGAKALPVAVNDDGVVSVDGEQIGTLDGFEFRVDPAARGPERRMSLAAAERFLAVERSARASRIAGSNNSLFALDVTAGAVPQVLWQGRAIATLSRGRHLLSPRVSLAPAIAALDSHIVAAVQSRLGGFVDESIGRFLRPLVTIAGLAREPSTPAGVRAILATLVDGCGIAAKADLTSALAELTIEQRRLLWPLGIKIGAMDIYFPALLKPSALSWLTALRAAWRGEGCGRQPPPGIFRVLSGADDDVPMLAYRRIGSVWLRVDMIEKMAFYAHSVRSGRRATAGDVGDALPPAVAAAPPSPGAFRIDPALGISLGLSLADRLILLDRLDFRLVANQAEPSAGNEGQLWWIWAPRKGGNRGNHGPGQQAGQRADLRAGKTRRKPAGKAGGKRAQSPDSGRQGGVANRSPVAAASPFAALAGLFDTKRGVSDGGSESGDQ